MELVSVEEGKAGNTMIGISYILEEEASAIRDKIKDFCNVKRYDKSFWEEALFDIDNKMVVYARVYKANQVFEINTYEQLREIDENSEHLNSDIISEIFLPLMTRLALAHNIDNGISSKSVLKTGEKTNIAATSLAQLSTDIRTQFEEQSSKPYNPITTSGSACSHFPIVSNPRFVKPWSKIVLRAFLPRPSF